MSGSLDSKQTMDEATTAACLTVGLVDLAEASMEVSVGREHTTDLLALLSAVLVIAAVVLGIPFSAVKMASAGLSEWLIIAVVVMETGVLMTLIMLARPRKASRRAGDHVA